MLLNITIKEICGYFRSPLGYSIIGVYLLISMLSTFYIGHFFAIDNSYLSSFFMFQPDIFTIIIPAITMKLWADEYKTGTIEFILTKPVSVNTLVFSKFLAAWIFCLILLLSTLPLWLSTAYISKTDNFNIFINYIACFCLSGAICAIGCVVSAFSKNLIISYILSFAIIAIIRQANLDSLLNLWGFSNDVALRILKSLNFDAHYKNLVSGQFAIDDIFYFIFLILGCLVMNIAAIDYKKN